MRTRRLWLAITFLGLAGGAFYVSGQPNTVRRIADGVWFREGDLQNEGHCNNIIIEMRDYLIIVDANFPSGARKALADAKRITDKPVRYVFDTHHHGDHAYGNAVWTQAGAITLAHAGVVEEMKAREPQRWQQTAKQRKDVAELNLPTVEPPKETFTKSPHVIRDGTRRVEFHHFGWAHTKGDGFVYLPRERILCTGDAAVNGAFNFTGDANLGNWANVLRAAQRLNVQTVLPGHGAPGGKEILEGQAQFFTELQNAVKAARGQGKKLEDIVTLKNGNPAATSIQLPDSVRNWVGRSLPAQVRDAYAEMEQGKPRGDLTL